MTKAKCTVLITDLDNTLWNWFEIWFASFSALLDGVTRISGVPVSILESEIREVHQRHRTTEYALLLEELPSLRAKHAGQDIPKIYDEAIHAFRKARKQTLKLYPGVQETLEAARAAGTLVVGYTESMAYATEHRLRNTGLDELLDFLYSAPDHEFPEGMTREQLRKYPAEYYRLAHTVHRHTPRGAVKPNPTLLTQIVREVGATPEETIYVGDSLMKDVAMAQKAGVPDVWARYGESHRKAEYEQLRRVSHWTDEDIAREKRLTHGDVSPTHTIDRFSELRELVSFERLARS